MKILWKGLWRLQKEALEPEVAIKSSSRPSLLYNGQSWGSHSCHGPKKRLLSVIVPFLSTCHLRHQHHWSAVEPQRNRKICLTKLKSTAWAKCYLLITNIIRVAVFMSRCVSVTVCACVHAHAINTQTYMYKQTPYTVDGGVFCCITALLNCQGKQSKCVR